MTNPEVPLACRITGRPITVELLAEAIVLVSPLQHQGESIRLSMSLPRPPPKQAFEVIL